MTRDKLGPLPDEYFENNLTTLGREKLDAAYSEGFIDRLSARVGEHMEKAFDPNQPRHPKGSKDGGKRSGGSDGCDGD